MGWIGMRAAGAALMLAASLPFAGAQAQPAPAGPSPYTCHFPTKPPAATADFGAFATYSWQMFVALNWVPMHGMRGVADCAKPIGSHPLLGPATVWQSFKFTDQIFLAGARNPGPWNSPWIAPVLREDSKASRILQKSSIGAVFQPVGGWLIDQNGNPTYYQIAANRTTYDYIVKHKLYNADIVNADRAIAFPEGAAEVKASWRILTKDDDKHRYLTMSATVATFDANGKPVGTKKATLGLVGLHVIVKPTGFPQYIWATFEQVDNVVAPPGSKASYMNPNAPASAVNQSPCQPGVLPCTPKPGTSFTTPDPLTRMTPIAPAVASVTADVQAKFAKTFVQYYELVGTQWPSDPNDPGDPLGTPTPNVLANVTLESYIQPTSSCMACHQTAVSGPNRYKSDFSFLFIHAQPPAHIVAPH